MATASKAQVNYLEVEVAHIDTLIKLLRSSETTIGKSRQANAYLKLHGDKVKVTTTAYQKAGKDLREAEAAIRRALTQLRKKVAAKRNTLAAAKKSRR